MNKSHRVVWSLVRNAFVVASETAKAKGKPSSTRKVIAAAVTTLFLAPGMASAFCPPGQTSITSALTTIQCYTDQAVTISNAGSVTVTETAGSGVAVYIDAAPYTSTFINNGSIKIDVNNPVGSAGANGIFLTDDVAGSIINNGTITANASAGTGDAYAWGIDVAGTNDLLTGGAITNNGTINATAISSTSYAYAYGIQVSGNADGSITNNGKIMLDVTARTDPEAYGIYVGGDLTGSILNKGTIGIKEVSTSSDLYAYGVYVGGNASGAITNSGTINMDLKPVSYVYTGAGIYVNGDLTALGSITNSGTISVLAETPTGNSAEAYGIYVGNDNLGNIVNSGNISITSSAESDATAYGIYVDNNVGAGASIINSGSINLTGTALVSETGHAYGIYVGTNVDGVVSNTGSIVASGTAATSEASAIGIYANTVSAAGSITNTGTITASANSGTPSSALAYGIYTNTLNGVINNSGTIKATASDSANAFSILANGGTGTINNLVGGLLDGIVYAGGSVNLNNAGTIDTHMESSLVGVGGNYTQSATGILKIGVLDTANYGSLRVLGTATLDAGTGIRVTADPAHTLAAGNVLANVIDAGTLNMSTINVQDNLLSLNFIAANNGANGVDLNTVATGLTTVTAAVLGTGLTSGLGAAGLLDSLLPSIDSQPKAMSDFLYSVGSASTQKDVSNKVAQLLPLITGGVNQATLDVVRDTNRVLLERQEETLGRASGDAFLGNKHVWLKPFGSWANQDDRKGALGYDANSYGLAFGLDGELSEANRIGAAFTYASTDIDGNASAAKQNADVDSYLASIYGSHKFSPDTDMSYRVGIGYHDNSGHRHIAGFGVAKSDYDSWSANAGVAFARSMPIDDVTTFTPSIRADYARIRSDSYHEKGSPLSLNVEKDTREELILGVDGKLSRAMNDTTTVMANLGIGYDVINDRVGLTSVFAGAPGLAFETKGIDPSPWLLRGGLGLAVNASETLQISARYDFEVRNDFDNQTASVKARWAF